MADAKKKTNRATLKVIVPVDIFYDDDGKITDYITPSVRDFDKVIPKVVSAALMASADFEKK